MSDFQSWAKSDLLFVSVRAMCRISKWHNHTLPVLMDAGQ